MLLRVSVQVDVPRRVGFPPLVETDRVLSMTAIMGVAASDQGDWSARGNERL